MELSWIENDLGAAVRAEAWTTVHHREVLGVLFERLDLGHTTKANGRVCCTNR